MKISIKRSDELVFMDLIPENQAEEFQLESIKKACEDALIVHSEDRQWSIQSLRMFLVQNYSK